MLQNMIMFSGIPAPENVQNKKAEEWTNKLQQLLKSVLDALSVLYDGLETGTF